MELVAEAKELKRDMEKEAYVLEEAAKRKENAPAPVAATEPNRSSAALKAPRIKLPVFDGESSEDFRGFMASLSDVATGEPNMGKIRKWLLLKQQLSGKALTLVKELPTAPETYKVALKLLEDAYGSERPAITKLYQRIQNLPPAEMTTESLRATHGQLEGILLHLERLKVPINSEMYLWAVVIGKYPGELAHILRITDEVELTEFRTLVGNYIKLRDGAIQPAMVTISGSGGASGGGTSGATDAKGTAGGGRNKQRFEKGAFSSSRGAAEKHVPPKQVNVSNKTKTNEKTRNRNRSCVFCAGEHWHDECDKHRTLAERLKLVEDRCQRCLRPKHATEEECRYRRTCFYCREATYNSALCPKQFTKILLTGAGGNAEVPSRFITAVLPISGVGRAKQTETRVILDTAGGRSLITADLAAELGLKEGEGKKVRFVGVNKAPLYAMASTSCKIWLLPPGARPIEVEAFIVPEIVENVTSTDVTAFKEQYPRYAEQKMPPEGNGTPVKLLLGYRSLVSIVTLQSSITVAPHLHLISTRFGWIPMGTLPTEKEDIMDSSVVALLREQDPIKVMSSLELVGLGDFLKSNGEEEALVLDKFNKSIKRLGKRYEVEWPYNCSDPELEDNFGLAFGRLVSLHRQLVKNPVLLKAYDDLIQEQIEDGVVETVNLRVETDDNLVHYLPHRAVVREGKSTPIRIVFDAAARCGKHAKSLNDVILKGGNWVTEIPAVLLRFRRYGVAVTSDISRAFHQISIAPKDRDVVRFLWLRDVRKPPTRSNLIVYRFRRMAFGIVASPFLLTATIKHHFKKFPNKYGAIIERDLYADNLIVSLPYDTEANHFYRTVKDCFNDMSMSLRQWTTDSSELRNNFETGDAAQGDNHGVLGLQWNTNENTLKLKNPHLPTMDTGKVTKRIALKEMATVYDPLGWVSPTVLKARLFIRKIWRKEYNWETALPEDLTAEWRILRKHLNEVHILRMPRTYGFGGIEKAQTVELHTFCDASAEAYRVVIYLRICAKEGIWTGLVASKTRLTPNTKLSIPRLELLAAVTTKYLWGDSRCVIAWYNSDKVLPVFIDKAVKAKRSTGILDFRYVPTTENPADVVSRGATIDELTKIGWWNGPTWLQEPAKWPENKQTCEKEIAMEQNSIEKEEHEINAQILLVNSLLKIRKEINPTDNNNAPFDIHPQDYSSIGALYRRTAYCLRAAGKFLRGRGSLAQHGSLDYGEAKRRWIQWDQRRYYQPTEQKTNVSYLKNLRITEDENGIMRCHTRLIRARYETQPILLVKKSNLTKLIVLSIHIANAHVGTAHTLAALRRQYWLPHGRREVYQVIKNHCHTCRRYEAQPYKTPEMSSLPAFRVNKTETPFKNTGVDVFGPFRVKIGEEGNAPILKKWVIIFTCLVVHAVHFEVLDDMTAGSFLDSFRKFVGRRGVPEIVVCDNAPQFYIVEGIFQSIWHRFAEAEINEKYYAQKQIQWRFIPAHSPWMGGGAYERLIKEAKRAFERTYGQLILSSRKFEIAIIEIEGILNGRPITYVDRENETELITPNDFLQMKYPAIPVDFDRAITGTELMAAWKAAEIHLQQFWKDWAEMYLKEIRERRETIRNPKLTQDCAPVVGELVLKMDPMQRRSDWHTAVVERLIASEDGTIRAVQLRAAHRVRIIRPVSKLAPLRLLMSLSTREELVDQRRAVIVDDEPGELTL